MFRTRLLSGIVLVIIAFAAFLLGAPVLTILLFAISLVGYGELTKALGVSEGRDEKMHFGAPKIVGCAGVVLYYLALFLTDIGILENGMFFLTACVTAVFLAELFAYVFAFPKYQAEQISFAFFSFIYAPVMLSFIDLTRGLENGKFLVWFVLICSWGCDTCAYCVGKLIGKKKIFPVLSPKKSLEGCVGGVVGAAFIAFLYGIFVADDIPESLLFALVGAIGAVVSMVGDLAASAIKRNKGIKDYGKLIPGHGGIMDRFDSVIVTAPIIYFLSALFL
jgi:phosphatidate cytidylyltransferase